jgi:hypothetical protein
LVPPSAPGALFPHSRRVWWFNPDSFDAGFSLPHRLLLPPGAGPLCLSGSNASGNITETVEEHFGKTGGVVITSSTSSPFARCCGFTASPLPTPS